MLINKDPSRAHAVKIEFAHAESRGAAVAHFRGPVTMVTFGAEQYAWHPDGPKSHADPDGPPVTSTMNPKAGDAVSLPRASITILRGQIE
jgi:hypothetical protein